MQDNDTVPGWIAVPGELLRGVVGYVEGLAFWTAVFVPVAYVPLLLTGLSTVGDAALLIQLLTVNTLALVLGHGYAGTEGSARGTR